jgi:hypothetical protein
MDSATRGHFLQLLGTDALAAAEAFAADLPPALVAPFEALLWTLDQGTADQCHTEQRRVDTLIRAHLTTGAWYGLLLDHCGARGWTCCEHVDQPEQRLLPEGGSYGR